MNTLHTPAPALLEERFDALWARYGPAVKAQAQREAARRGLGSEDVEELVQETRIALYQAVLRLGVFSVQTCLRRTIASYLRGTVARRAADAGRVLARRPVTTAADLPDGEATLDRAIGEMAQADDPATMVLQAIGQAAAKDQLRAEIERLPDKQRRAIELVHLGEAPYAEAAARLELAVGTVKSQVHDGLKTLRRRATAEEWGL